MPEIIEFYTGEKPMLSQRADLAVLAMRTISAMCCDHLPELVVKEVHGSGGYGMLVGPTSSRAQIARVPREARSLAVELYCAADARSVDRADASRRTVSRRAMSIFGPSCCLAIACTSRQGGFTRVALKKGSLVVNSSQGGGTKDTWVLED